MSGSHARNVHLFVLLGLTPVLALSPSVRDATASSCAGQSAPSYCSARASGSGFTASPHVQDITLRTDPGRSTFGAHSETWGDNLVVDLNRDGNADVLLSNHMGLWQLLLGQGHGDFTLAQKLPRIDRHNCAPADFGGPHGHPDGRVDLYCVRGADKGTTGDKRNELLIQQENGRLVAEPTTWGAGDPSGRGRTVSILHIRHGGVPSLFVGDAKGINYPSKDRIYINKGGHFVNAYTAGLPSEQNTWNCSSTADFDRDGRQDLLACSHVLHLYRNLTTRHGPVRYREVALREGISGARMHAELMDLNRDGWSDLVSVTKKALVVRLNRRHTPHFGTIDYRFPLAAGFSFCSGAANRDDSPDLLVVQGLASPTDKVQRRDWMLLNAGSGRAFRPLPVPQAPFFEGSNGNGDMCSAIPNYRGEVSAWTINNGRPTYTPERFHRGYRQLVILAR